MEIGMRYALVDGVRTCASKNLTGYCPCCGSPVAPKCGEIRAHHWAHRGERTCDVWWDPRTEWHYKWQDQFPADWQEVICQSPSGEKHIADIKTPLGFTIEFQHSSIGQEERRTREYFYRRMAWVVDGSRLKSDLPHFLKGCRSLRPTHIKGVYSALDPAEVFPRTWISSVVPVFFDFSDATIAEEHAVDLSQSLWCLLPGRIFGTAIIVKMSRTELLRRALSMPSLLPVGGLQREIGQFWISAVRRKKKQVSRLHIVASSKVSRQSSRRLRPKRRLPRF